MATAFKAGRILEPSEIEENEIWEGGVLFGFSKRRVCREYVLAISAKPRGPQFGIFEFRNIVYPAPQDRRPKAILDEVVGHYRGHNATPARLNKDKQSYTQIVRDWNQFYELRAGTNHQGQPVRLVRVRERGEGVSYYGYFDTCYYRKGDPDCTWARREEE